MRKNIYSRQILMVNYQDFYKVGGAICENLIINKSLFQRYQQYKNTIASFLKEQEKQGTSNLKQEFGIAIQDAIDEEIVRIFEDVFSSSADLNYIQIQNAYLCAVMNEEPIASKLRVALLSRATVEKEYLGELHMSRQEFSNVYGADTLEYILAHDSYSYIQNKDMNALSDRNILLCHDGVVDERVILNEEGRSIALG